MRLEFHPKISADISEIVRYYGKVAGPQLAKEFYSELRAAFRKAGESPYSFSIRERDLRRVNLERFPYHFLFRIIADEEVRILSCVITVEILALEHVAASNGPN